jgi:DNA-binding MarR family transcriptional regulator
LFDRQVELHIAMKLEDELKMQKFQSPCQRATLNILFTAGWLAEKFNTVLKPYGISEQQYNVLRILRGQKGKTANLFMIQERMIHRMSNATRLVEKLRLKNYVKREVCEENRRMINIDITEKGLSVLEEIDLLNKDFETQLYRHLNIKEAIMIGDLLDKLRG